MAVSIVKQGEGELPGLTDTVKPKRLGPKRANHIRKFFSLDKKDDVRKFVIRRTVTREGKPDYTKAPKIQRLVTPQRLQRKRHRIALKRRRAESAKEQAYVFCISMSFCLGANLFFLVTNTTSCWPPVYTKSVPSAANSESGEFRRCRNKRGYGGFLCVLFSYVTNA